MKITALRTMRLSFPFVCPLGAPYSQTARMGALVVFVDTDQGVTGEGLLIAAHDKRFDVHQAMVNSLAGLVIGRDPTFSEGLCEQARSDAHHLGTSGVVNMAIGALDSALLDVRAKLAGLPVHRFLGAVRDRVPAYYSSGLWNHVPIDRLVATAQSIVSHGYRAMKLRVSPGNLPEQVARVKAVREALGPDIKLMVDAGRRFDVPGAIRLGRALEPFDLEWFEEPLSGECHDGEAQIAAALDMNLASGESIFSVEDFARVIAQRSFDVLMPDLCRIGGPSQFIRVAHLAEMAQLPVSGHVLPEHTLALMASLRNGTYLEVMPWSLPLFADQIKIENGFALAPERPGWGYRLDLEALKAYQQG
jgi:L-alanine-DL-glutamate epimerase-like enolase superfamily enzyme